MSDKSKIEWTDASWTPIRARNKATGAIGWHCEHVTPGCESCYAEAFNHRFGTKLPFKPGHRKDVELFLKQDALLQPLRWDRPRMIFVCSMTDLFADFVPDECVDQMFAVMALTPHHTYQVLTKRAKRMQDYLGNPHGSLEGRIFPHWANFGVGQFGAAFKEPQPLQFPLPNVWLGVSAEDQKRADERIPHLLQTPAAVRFVSAEPLLGPIELATWMQDLDWVIVGGESGPDARPMHPGWARTIRDQCQAASVPFFFKQWGEWASVSEVAGAGKHFHLLGSVTVRRVGKKLAGRALDGREYSEMPERAS